MAQKTKARVEVYETRAGRFRFRHVALRRLKTAPGGGLTTMLVAAAGARGYANRQAARRAAKREHPGLAVVSVL